MIAHANFLDKVPLLISGNADKRERVMAARLVDGIDPDDSVQFQDVRA